VIGGMTLEQTLTSRDSINDQLRGILDDATGKWGIRVHRVELKAVDPPPSIKDTMEKQMRADREKRAAILQAEGVKQAAILAAEGEKQAAILRAEGQKQSAILSAQGQAEAIGTVFKAIHDGDADPKLLAYQYLQMLPQIAQGDANKVWIVPSEIGKALEGIGGFFSNAAAARNPDTQGAESAPAPSGPGSQLDAPAGRHAGLEGWLAGGSGPVHDGTVGDHEGGSVPGAGNADGAPLRHDPALMEGSSEMGASV